MKELNAGDSFPYHPEEGSPRSFEFPDSYQETTVVAGRIFRECTEVLKGEKLSDLALQKVNDVMGHLHTAWYREYTDPLVEEGVRVLQSHFAMVFGLDPNATYLSILQEAFSSRYFEKRNPDDPKLIAFSKVMTHDLRVRDMKNASGDIGIEIDFSGLVNPNWKPPKPA